MREKDSHHPHATTHHNHNNTAAYQPIIDLPPLNTLTTPQQHSLSLGWTPSSSPAPQNSANTAHNSSMTRFTLSSPALDNKQSMSTATLPHLTTPVLRNGRHIGNASNISGASILSVTNGPLISMLANRVATAKDNDDDNSSNHSGSDISSGGKSGQSTFDYHHNTFQAMSSAFAWFYAVSRIPAVNAKVRDVLQRDLPNISKVKEIEKLLCDAVKDCATEKVKISSETTAVKAPVDHQVDSSNHKTEQESK
jgi:hypothetical protein